MRRLDAVNVAKSVGDVILRQYEDTASLLVLAGSWSYGRPHALSDIDLQLIIDGTLRRIEIPKCSLEIELVVTTRKEFYEKLLDAEQYGIVEMLVLGDVLYMKPHRGAELLDTALRYFKNGLPPLKILEALTIRRVLQNRLKSAYSALDKDHSTQMMALGTSAYALCQAALRAKGIWRGKPVQYLYKLEQIHPELTRQIRFALDNRRPVEDRVKSLACATELVRSEYDRVIATLATPSPPLKFD